MNSSIFLKGSSENKFYNVFSDLCIRHRQSNAQNKFQYEKETEFLVQAIDVSAFIVFCQYTTNAAGRIGRPAVDYVSSIFISRDRTDRKTRDPAFFTVRRAGFRPDVDLLPGNVPAACPRASRAGALAGCGGRHSARPVRFGTSCGLHPETRPGRPSECPKRAFLMN